MKAYIAVLLFVAYASCTWQIVDQDFATIALATSFTGSTTGYVAGGTAGLQPLFLYTTDGGNNFSNRGMNDSNVGAMLSIRMASETWGIAGGLGFIELPCGAYTNDGSTWYNMEQEFALFCAFQGAAIVDDEQTGVLVGSFSDRRDWTGNGLKITTDGGNSWSQRNGDTGDTPVRYGSFLSKDMGYVTAGIWPEADVVENIEDLEEFHLNRHISMNVHTKEIKFNRRSNKRGEEASLGYVAMLSQVTNEGKDWKLMLNETDAGYYFNEISCTDSNNCWAVLQGVDGFGNDTGLIYNTNDGWNTYSTQLTASGVALTAIDMMTSSYGWAAGAIISGPQLQGDFDAAFYVTNNGGATWTLDSTIRNFFPMDVTVPDSTHAYSAGITPVGLSSFASYST